METSEKINELAEAFSLMQSEMESAIKYTQAYKYRYSDLATVWSVLRGPMTKNGLSISQEAKTIPEGVSVTTRVMHKSGQWIEHGPLVIPVGKKDAHSTGSAITYGKRYALSAALGIVAEEDDDGNRAQKDAPEKQNITPMSDDELEKFIEKWSEKYGKENIEQYLIERANHFKHDVRVTAAQMSESETNFEKNISIWLERKKNA